MSFGASAPQTPARTAETFVVHSRNVACDGGDGPLGHPRVWLHIEHEQIVCPYCSRTYHLAPGAGDGHGH